jgi:hypothetical protein
MKEEKGLRSMMQHHRIRLSTGNCLMSSLVDVEGMSNSGTFLSSTFNPLSLTHSLSSPGLVPKSARKSEKDPKEADEGGREAEGRVARGVGEREQNVGEDKG